MSITVRELTNLLLDVPEKFQDKSIKIEQFDKRGTKIDIKELRLVGTPICSCSGIPDNYDIMAEAAVIITNDNGFSHLNDTEKAPD